MSRYIDADKIYPWYLEAFAGEINPNDVRFSMNDISCNLINIPTADAVDVVRCKDCKYFENDHVCLFYSRHGTIETTADDYCSNGERATMNEIRERYGLDSIGVEEITRCGACAFYDKSLCHKHDVYVDIDYYCADGVKGEWMP